MPRGYKVIRQKAVTFQSSECSGLSWHLGNKHTTQKVTSAMEMMLLRRAQSSCRMRFSVTWEWERCSLTTGGIEGNTHAMEGENLITQPSWIPAVFPGRDVHLSGSVNELSPPPTIRRMQSKNTGSSYHTRNIVIKDRHRRL